MDQNGSWLAEKKREKRTNARHSLSLPAARKTTTKGNRTCTSCATTYHAAACGEHNFIRPARVRLDELRHVVHVTVERYLSKKSHTAVTWKHTSATKHSSQNSFCVELTQMPVAGELCLATSAARDFVCSLPVGVAAADDKHSVMLLLPLLPLLLP
jgi:hypothetical protein